MSDIFQEVQEEYRREQVAQAWTKYRVPIIAAAAGLILAVAAYQGWLADPAYALWIVEEGLGAPIGYAMLGPATLPGTVEGDLELKRIYILHRWHGGGQGKALFVAVQDEAKRRGASRLILAVYTANTQAQAFYARQGMAVIGMTRFMVGSTGFDDLVMARAL